MPRPERTARSEAVHQLERIESGGAFPNLMSMPAALDARARRQLTDLVAGVTRWRRWLDFVLNQYTSRPVEKLDAPLRQVLRLALFELTERSRPPHAIVNEYVALAGTVARRQTKGFANAVLRRLSTQTDRLPEPDVPDPAERLAIRWSHPTWMVRRWLDRFGEEETRALLSWNNSPPVFGVRVNTLKTERTTVESCLSDAGVAWTASRVLDDFLCAESVQPLLQAGLLREGKVHVQDESAGLVVRVVDPQPGETVVDACAAPGGKLLYMCMRMGDRGRIVAIDASATRLRLAEKSARAAGCSIVTYSAEDATSLPEGLGALRADRVLLDAPCSGHGVLSRRPDMRWRRSMTDIAELAVLQDRLIDSVSRLVRPGGLLVYSTCTIEPEENEERIAAFLERNDSFHVDPVANIEAGDLISREGHFASLPQRHGMDGAFAARLRRSG